MSESSTRRQQVMENLIGNAIKYGRRPGEPAWIWLSGYEDEERVSLTVRDNGPGIPIQFREKVFGVFQRSSTTTEGTGIGLSIVRKIVEAHGGRIWIVGPEEAGAEFRIEILKCASNGSDTRDGKDEETDHAVLVDRR